MNRFLKNFIIAAAVAGFAATAATAMAQEIQVPQQAMTLKECMEYAVSNSTKMRIQQADTRDAQVERRSAILEAFTPSVSAGSYAYYNFGRSVDPETNTYKSTTSFQNGYQASGSLALFNGFAAVNNLKITKTAAAMGVSREEQTRDEVCLATMEAYYNVVYYNQMAKAIEDEVAAAQKAVQLARRQEQLGQKGYADVVQIEADLAAKEYKLVNTRNMYNDALLTLKDIMFWPLDQQLEIDFSMADEAALQNGETIVAEGFVGNTKEDIVQNALTTLPAAYIARGEMLNAKRAFNTSKWQLLPSLNLSGGWSTSYFTYPDEKNYVAPAFHTQFTNNMGEYIQLSMSIPIYGRLYRQATVAKKKNAYVRATAQYEQKVREIEAEVTRALQDKEGAGAAFLQASRQAQVQTEAYKFSTKKFEQGMISPIEYQTASGNWLAAKAEQLNALLKYYLKKSVVEYYNGVPYIEQ